MKRLIVVSLLIIALPFMASVNNNQSAAYAGHIMIGGAYCDGSCAGGRCTSCGATCSDGQLMASIKKGGAQTSHDATDVIEPNLLLFALAFFIVARLRS